MMPTELKGRLKEDARCYTWDRYIDYRSVGAHMTTVPLGALDERALLKRGGYIFIPHPHLCWFLNLLAKRT